MQIDSISTELNLYDIEPQERDLYFQEKCWNVRFFESFKQLRRLRKIICL